MISQKNAKAAAKRKMGKVEDSPILSADTSMSSENEDVLLSMASEGDWTSGRMTEQYHSIAEAIPHMVFIADAKGNADYYNNRYYRYAGDIDPDAFEREVLHPDDFGRCQKTWDDSIASGKPYEIEYRLRRASDGMYRWHLGRALPIRDLEGTIVRWFGTCTDIHDQKTAQEEVRKLNQQLEERVAARTSELETANLELANEIRQRLHFEKEEHANLERLKNMIEILPLGALVTDEKRTIVHVNERFCQMFELYVSPSSLIGKSMMEVLRKVKQASIKPEHYLQRLEKALNSDLPVLAEEMELKNGRIIVRDYLPIYAKAHSRGNLLLYREVTQERRIDAAKSEFMSLASHQLRTPLTSIRWSLGRLAKQVKERMDDKEARLLDTARDAVAHMANSIDTMLSISRIEAGKITLKNIAVDLSVLLETVVSAHKELAEKGSLTLTVDCPAGLSVTSDQNLLEEILVNLVSNAIKYTPAGGTVALRAATDDEVVTIDVADTGYGNPLQQHKKIFTKVFRGENILRFHTDGTGLGLYLSHRLVELLGGELTFFSRENQGTTFTLRLR